MYMYNCLTSLTKIDNTLLKLHIKQKELNYFIKEVKTQSTLYKVKWRFCHMYWYKKINWNKSYLTLFPMYGFEHERRQCLSLVFSLHMYIGSITKEEIKTMMHIVNGKYM